MYKIIGADGKEYGPVSPEQLRQWIAEGRVNRQTKVLPEGSTEWRMLGDFPEFFGAGTTPPPPPPLSGAAAPLASGSALDKVNGPAIGLMVTGILNLLTAGGSLIFQVLGTSAALASAGPFQNAPWAHMFSGTLGLVSTGVSLLIGFVILFGGLKMKNLESHGLAVTASILAILPCTSPCCLIGIPIGIWALVILMKPEVKSAFH